MSRLQYKLYLIIENQNISEHEIIDELNSQEVERLVPTIIYLSLIIIAGIPGNGLVCYIYRSNAASSSSWFIFFLAVVDFVLCVSIVPAEISSVCYQCNFKSELLCKSSKFLNLWSLLSLGFTLVIVSIDRYKKVCRPFSHQIDFKKARILSVGGIILGFVLSLPILCVYGIYQFDIDVGVFNVTAYECSFRQTASEFSFAFYYVLIGMLFFTAALATICILYVFIGKAIKQHTLRESIKSNVIQSASLPKRPQSIDSVSNNIKTIKDNLPKSDESCQSTVDSTANEAKENSSSLSDEEETYEFEKPVLQVWKTKLKALGHTNYCPVRKAKTPIATLSMFLISAVFVLSYLPLLCLLLVKSVLPDFTEIMSDGAWAVYMFFLRSYFFNCAINPFMYGIADSNFRGNCTIVIFQMYDKVLRFIGCRR